MLHDLSYMCLAPKGSNDYKRFGLHTNLRKLPLTCLINTICHIASLGATKHKMRAIINYIGV